MMKLVLTLLLFSNVVYSFLVSRHPRNRMPSLQIEKDDVTTADFQSALESELDVFFEKATLSGAKNIRDLSVEVD